MTTFGIVGQRWLETFYMTKLTRDRKEKWSEHHVTQSSIISYQITIFDMKLNLLFKHYRNKSVIISSHLILNFILDKNFIIIDSFLLDWRKLSLNLCIIWRKKSMVYSYSIQGIIQETKQTARKTWDEKQRNKTFLANKTEANCKKNIIQEQHEVENRETKIFLLNRNEDTKTEP